MAFFRRLLQRLVLLPTTGIPSFLYLTKLYIQPFIQTVWCPPILSSMNLHEISSLYANLILDDNESPLIKVRGTRVCEAMARMEICFVDKILGYRNVNHEGLKTVLKLIWRTKNSVIIEPVGSYNTFVFHFGSSEDHRRVYTGGPWTLNRSLIVLNKPNGLGYLSSTDFSKTAFWIQLQNVLLGLRMKIMQGSRMRPLELWKQSTSPDLACEFVYLLMCPNLSSAASKYILKH
ncbi:DUF4283 domain-containing protein [Abeliophyllum distichum]|uniref:DUF4283 domain-containing protein n=1 Tax=Abeliophyllum distichum TaxID=126358 RepID=A0ABD1V8P1_9LAMI